MIQSMIVYYTITDSLHQSNCLHMPWQHLSAEATPHHAQGDTWDTRWVCVSWLDLGSIVQVELSSTGRSDNAIFDINHVYICTIWVKIMTTLLYWKEGLNMVPYGSVQCGLPKNVNFIWLRSTSECTTTGVWVCQCWRSCRKNFLVMSDKISSPKRHPSAITWQLYPFIKKGVLARRAFTKMMTLAYVTIL